MSSHDLREAKTEDEITAEWDAEAEKLAGTVKQADKFLWSLDDLEITEPEDEEGQE